MQIRRVGLLAAIAFGLALAAAIGLDLSKINRKIPQSAPPQERATLVLVEKQARRLSLMRHGETLKAFDMALGGNPIGHKQQEGDRRTPEGRYVIDFKNARSRFHLALRISYPDDRDRERARARSANPGSDIMIHGLPNGLGWLSQIHLLRDWTDGCMAVTNSQIDEIWAMVDVGTPVQINP
jgi:murein L,D-transpeptidase YafK